MKFHDAIRKHIKVLDGIQKRRRTKDLELSSTSEWKKGDKGKLKDGTIVTIADVGQRMLRIEEDLEKKLYIPGHGEIEKI